MNDTELDRQLAAADPYLQPKTTDLRGADRALLEEILADAPRVPERARRSWRLPLAGSLASAAVLAAALIVPAWVGSTDSPEATTPPSTSEPTADTPIRYAAAVEVARRNPRLLIGEPGWRATHVSGFAEDEGTIAFEKGDRELEFAWYPADQHDEHFEDRRHSYAPRPFSIDGQEGSEFRYSSKDIAVILRPSGGTFAEIRTGIGGWRNRAEIVAVLRTIRAASVEEWLAAMPTEIVTPGKTSQAIAELLTGVPLPPDLARKELALAGTNDRYQTSVRILDSVVCGWLNTLERAEDEGDTAARRTATNALIGAHDWPLLKPMDATGMYADWVRQVADNIAAGHDAAYSRQRFGCR